MENLAIKILAIGVLFVLAFLGGLVPICCIKSEGESFGNGVGKHGKGRRTGRVISLLNSAAAGIFLSVAIVRLLPDVRLIFETSLNITASESVERLGDRAMDWAGFTACSGFLLVVFIEQLMLFCLERSETIKNAQRASDEIIFADKSDIDEDIKVGDSYGTLRERSPSQCQSDVSDASLASSTILRGLDDLQPIDSFRAFALLVSLSLHCLFEGLALGLQLESQGTISLLIAISAHKAVESFTVLLRFIRIPGKEVLKWTCLIVFSLTSPIGIAIGIPLADPSVNADALLVNGILQGLATGTFMFVAFVELLPAELEGKDDRMLKFLCILAGFGLMTILTHI